MLSCYEEPDFITFPELESTNNYVATLVRLQKINKITIVSADYQTEGRGQRASKWQSPMAQNALFSIYAPWKGLRIADQFLVSMMVALSIVEVLYSALLQDVQIKWPNDIYVDKKKIGGILIESDVSGEHVNASIIGIGLNVNQVAFDPALHATSLKLETGQDHDRIGVIKKIVQNLMEKCKAGEDNTDLFYELKKAYLNRLLGWYQWVRVRSAATSKLLTIKPLDITRSGLLLATDDNNSLHTFDLKEIVWEF